MLMPVVLTTIVYVLLSLGVGLWQSKNRTFSEFVAAPNSFGTFFIALSIMGTVVGGAMFFTVAQMGYEAGFAVLSLPISYLLGYVLLSFGCNPPSALL